MIRRKICINFLILISTLAVGNFIAAQNHVIVLAIDSLRKVLRTLPDDTNKVSLFNKLSAEQEALGEDDSAVFYANLSEALAKKLGYNKSIANLFNSIGNRYFQEGNFLKSLECYFHALSLAKETDNKRAMGAALGNLGNIYMKQGNYPQAVEYYYKAIALAKEVGYKEGVASHLGNLAIAFEEQGNYTEALDNNFKALKLAYEVGRKYVISHTLNNIGVVYDKQSKYDSALYYQLKALDVAMQINQPENLADIGNTYADQGNYPKAIEYYSQALKVAKAGKDMDGIANLYSDIGIVYTKLKNYKDAKKFLDSALVLSMGVGDKIYIRDAYKAMADLERATADYKGSYADYEKYIAYRDSIINQESVRRITQMEIGHKFEKREDSIIAEHEKADIIKGNEIKTKNIITDSSILISILALLSAFLLINRAQIKRRRDKIIFEREKHFIAIELNSAKNLLGEYVNSIVEKNNLIEQFRNDLETVKNTKAQEEKAEKRLEQLDYLNKITILTEEDWNKFKELFEQVYKGFFVRLKEKLPNLTQAEIRLICLTKLKLDTKHMAAIIGVSSSTIEQSRYRLKKKLNLSKDDSLTAFIESI